MKRAVIRLGRRYAGERPGEIPPGLLRYGHEMKLATWQANVPLLLDHDEAKRIGTVDELVTFDDVDGRWLAQGQRSIPTRDVGSGKAAPHPSSPPCCMSPRSSPATSTAPTYKRSRSSKPKNQPEPGARLTLIYEPEKQARRATAAAHPLRPGQARVTWAIGHRPRSGREETVELNARITLAERAGLPADVEAILGQLRADLGYPTARWWERWQDDVAA
jgi:hypothetical protein